MKRFYVHTKAASRIDQVIEVPEDLLTKTACKKIAKGLTMSLYGTIEIRDGETHSVVSKFK